MKKYDIKYAFREYESQGMKKTYWTTHGTLWIDDMGKMKMKINSVPVVDCYEGWYHLFEHIPLEQRQQPQQYQGLPKGTDLDDLDVPF